MGRGCGGGRVQEGCLKPVYPLKDEVHTLPSTNPSAVWCWATWLHLIHFISSLCTDVTSLWNLLSENRPGHFLKPKGTQTQQRLISSALPGLETESVLSPGAILRGLPWIWKGVAFSLFSGKGRQKLEESLYKRSKLTSSLCILP